MMRLRKKIVIRKTFIVLFLATCMFSCVNTRKATYFNDLSDSVIPYSLESLEPIIQKNDILSISVSSLNASASEVFNAPNISSLQASTSAGGNSIASGYLVDQDGFIKFPVLGELKAVGLTKKEFAKSITSRLIELKQLYDPIVNVRYLNFKVTVLGEVNHPTVVNVPNEKITLLEALGLAGDATVYARKDNVMVLRVAENGDKIVKYIDLNSKELLTSPYFYLKSNDVVYVQTNTSKIASTGRVNQYLPVVFAFLSLAVIAVDRLFR